MTDRRARVAVVRQRLPAPPDAAFDEWTDAARERPHRVAFTWSCSTWPDPAIQTVVTVTIEPDGAGASIMTIEHELLPPALVQQHAHGRGTPSRSGTPRCAPPPRTGCCPTRNGPASRGM